MVSEPLPADENCAGLGRVGYVSGRECEIVSHASCQRCAALVGRLGRSYRARLALVGKDGGKILRLIGAPPKLHRTGKSQGSFDCVMLRFAKHHFAQDDKFGGFCEHKKGWDYFWDGEYLSARRDGAD